MEVMKDMGMTDSQYKSMRRRDKKRTRKNFRSKDNRGEGQVNKGNAGNHPAGFRGLGRKGGLATV